MNHTFVDGGIVVSAFKMALKEQRTEAGFAGLQHASKLEHKKSQLMSDWKMKTVRFLPNLFTRCILIYGLYRGHHRIKASTYQEDTMNWGQWHETKMYARLRAILKVVWRRDEKHVWSQRKASQFNEERGNAEAFWKRNPWPSLRWTRFLVMGIDEMGLTMRAASSPRCPGTPVDNL